MTIESLLTALASLGDITILVIAYFIYSIKHNHLPHIYDRLGDVEKLVEFNRGVLSKGNNDTDTQIGPTN